jgi:DNA-binding NtrC family response regulator
MSLASSVDSSQSIERRGGDGSLEHGSASGFGRVIGSSPAMRRLYPLLERLAQSSVPVVIEGETGTGKEVLAESLHAAGPRSSQPFVVFDCTAVAPNLVEAALFGHERGAFTGAIAAKRGVFEEAHGGTLLIDEIGDLELSLQASLLRALECSEVRRIGGSGFTRVDVRVLATTRRNLEREVQAGRFRDDLFFRLAVTRIELPPLRRRKGDIETLARYFWGRLSRGASEVPAEFVQSLETYDWPGNVRELHNAVARRFALGELAGPVAASKVVLDDPDGGSEPYREILGLELPLPLARRRLLEDFERYYVERVLARFSGNVTRAAQAAGIARRNFQLRRARARRFAR